MTFSGLYWFAETSRYWPNGQADDAIEVVRKNGELILRLNIKKPGQSMPASWILEFGLLITPVKPLRDNWRGIRLDPYANANYKIIWPDKSPSSFKYYGYPVVEDKVRYEASIAALQDRGVNALPYICPTHIATNVPEWKYFPQ